MTYVIIRALLVIFILLSVPVLTVSEEVTSTPVQGIAAKIAEEYGLSDFEQISEIEFTFNARVNDKTVKRTWKWDVETDTVHYKNGQGEDKWLSYKRQDIRQLSTELREVDSKFINDQYWLLFPFHLVWDRGIHISSSKNEQKLPIGPGKAEKISVKYPQQGGYTPGDIYELFVGDDNRILEWVYRRGGSEEPSRISTWEDYRMVGPLLISFDHVGPGDRFRVWFTDVSVKMKNGKLYPVK